MLLDGEAVSIRKCECEVLWRASSESHLTGGLDTVLYHNVASIFLQWMQCHTERLQFERQSWNAQMVRSQGTIHLVVLLSSLVRIM